MVSRERTGVAMIRNVHQRTLTATKETVGSLLDGLASEHDQLWPGDRWPAIRFDRPLAVGAKGGHGMVRYDVESYERGRSIVLRFDPSIGLVGMHRLDVIDDPAQPDRATLRHAIEGTATGSMRVVWPLAVRWLHDVVLEDLLDNAEAAVAQRPVVRTPFRLHIRALRRVMTLLGPAQMIGAPDAPSLKPSSRNAPDLG
jgi:hypothetical protein